MDDIENWSFARGFQSARDYGFTEDELEQLRERWERESDEELVRRLKGVPSTILNRILWDGAISHMVFPHLPDVRPSLGYFLLPIADTVEAEERNTLVIPPHPIQAVEIRWPWSSYFCQMLQAPGGRGVDWLTMMTEEFGLLPEQEGAWVSPNRGSSAWDVKRYASFWRELEMARQIEAEHRLAAMTNWLEARGMDGVVTLTDCIVVIPRVGDHNPERATYIFRVELKRDTYCLISRPFWSEPVFLAAPFSGAKDFFQTQDVEQQNEWLRQLRDGHFD